MYLIRKTLMFIVVGKRDFDMMAITFDKSNHFKNMVKRALLNFNVT